MKAQELKLSRTPARQQGRARMMKQSVTLLCAASCDLVAVAYKPAATLADWWARFVAEQALVCKACPEASWVVPC